MVSLLKSAIVIWRHNRKRGINCGISYSDTEADTGADTKKN